MHNEKKDTVQRSLSQRLGHFSGLQKVSLQQGKTAYRVLVDHTNDAI
jgi:hypothetical protein